MQPNSRVLVRGANDAKSSKDSSADEKNSTASSGVPVDPNVAPIANVLGAKSWMEFV